MRDPRFNQSHFVVLLPRLSATRWAVSRCDDGRIWDLGRCIDRHAFTHVNVMLSGLRYLIEHTFDLAIVDAAQIKPSTVNGRSRAVMAPILRASGRVRRHADAR
jgi:hypothetical protein